MSRQKKNRKNKKNKRKSKVTAASDTNGSFESVEAMSEISSKSDLEWVEPLEIEILGLRRKSGLGQDSNLLEEETSAFPIECDPGWKDFGSIEEERNFYKVRCAGLEALLEQKDDQLRSERAATLEARKMYVTLKCQRQRETSRLGIDISLALAVINTHQEVFMSYQNRQSSDAVLHNLVCHAIESIQKQRRRISTYIMTISDKLSNAEKRIEQLEADVRELKAHGESLDPLVMNGIANRLRFLENARPRLWRGKVIQVDKPRVERGNKAAHDGCGRADTEALRIAGLLDSELATTVFEKLYRIPLTEYEELSHSISSILDHHATLCIGPPLKETENMRNDALAIATNLFGYFNQIGMKRLSIFESDPNVVESLERLHQLVIDISELETQHRRAKSGC